MLREVLSFYPDAIVRVAPVVAGARTIDAVVPDPALARDVQTWIGAPTRDSPERSALAARAEDSDAPAGPDDVAWLQPMPDSMLDAAAPGGKNPEAVVWARETIEIGFLTVIQLLTPQQRAALILCDVLDWSAKEAAELLDISVAAANSALQRARATLRKQLPSRKPVWPRGVDATDPASGVFSHRPALGFVEAMNHMLNDDN